MLAHQLCTPPCSLVMLWHTCEKLETSMSEAHDVVSVLQRGGLEGACGGTASAWMR